MTDQTITLDADTIASWDSVPTAELRELLDDCRAQAANPNSETHRELAEDDVALYAALIAARKDGDTSPECTYELTITSVPADVDVTDDRGTVAGARVEIRSPVDWQGGTVIPREGTGYDCWIDGDIVSYLEQLFVTYRISETTFIDAIDILADCAAAGARGESLEAVTEGALI